MSLFREKYKFSNRNISLLRAVCKTSKNLAKNSFSFKWRHFHSTGTIFQLPKRKNMPLLTLQNQHGACVKTEEERPNCFLFNSLLNFYFPSKWLFWVQLTFKELYKIQFHGLKTLIQRFFKIKTHNSGNSKWHWSKLRLQASQTCQVITFEHASE